MEKEIWKDVVGYDGYYEVSNFGRIKSLPRIKKNRDSYYLTKEKILKLQLSKKGYYTIGLSIERIHRTKNVHFLVAEAFLNHTSCGHDLVVDHINDIKTDNRVENLQIVTNRFNVCKTQGRYSSKFKGVYWRSKYKRWISKITINGKVKHLGSFIDEEKASDAYQNALIENNLN